MATSTITLYKTKITPELNAMVDDIDTYLSSCTKEVINNFQYQKIKGDFTIKVQKGQDDLFDKYNYCTIKNSDDDRTYYFFILQSNWISENVIQYDVSMDTINTWKNEWSFSVNTTINRQHEDRFNATDKFNSSGFTLNKKIDKMSEGINDYTKICVSSENVIEPLTTEDVSTNFYLVYRNPDDNEEALEVALVSKDDLKILETSVGDVYINADDLTNGIYYYFTYFDNPDGHYSYPGVTEQTLATGDIIMMWKNGSNISFRKNGGTTITQVSFTFKQNTNFMRYSSSNTLDAYQISQLTAKFLMYAGQTQYLNKISNIDRTQSKLSKILELPYLPDAFTWLGNDLALPLPDGWSLNNRHELVLSNYTKEFERTLPDIDLANELEIDIEPMTEEQFKSLPHSKTYESKMKHSDFFTYKFVYDSFSSEVALERIGFNNINNKNLSVKFKPTNTLTSSLIFKWEPKNGTYHKLADYENIIYSNRNNELAVFTSAYLDYMRNGYNYDLKTKSNVLHQAILNTVVSAAGTILGGSLAKGGLKALTWASMGQSAASNINTTILNAVQADRDFQKNLTTLQNQATQVQSCNDIDLFNYYGDNKLKIMKYELSDKVQNAIYNLLRQTGYICNTTGIPNTTSRLRYNYIQCEPVFDNENSNDIFDKYYNDIKARFNNGVTVYHNVNNTWDFDKTYENWETSLFN